MPEVVIDEELQTNQNKDRPEVKFDPVCVDVPRIYDNCGAKDCLRDLTVFFTAEDQGLVESATSVRVTKASVLTSTINVESVAFHRGFYAVDTVFYFAVCCEIYTTNSIPATVTGLATYSKRVVLYGSDANVKTFSSSMPSTEIDVSDFDCCPGCPATLPTATVQVSCPVTLAAEISPVTAPVILPFVPENVAQFFEESLVAPATKEILVTLGIFTIVQLTRNVQLMIPSYDFCVPRKECEARTDDPCEAFNKIEFPTDSFFPPSTSECDYSGGNPFDCNCE